MHTEVTANFFFHGWNPDQTLAAIYVCPPRLAFFRTDFFLIGIISFARAGYMYESSSQNFFSSLIRIRIYRTELRIRIRIPQRDADRCAFGSLSTTTVVLVLPPGIAHLLTQTT
jgi:hypothetical protein